MGRRGPAPQYAKWQALERLLNDGVSLSEAACRVGVNRKTAKRWRNGRAIRYSDGRVVHYPSVINASPVKSYSPRYLSEEERGRLADLLREGCTMRKIAALMVRAPSTISRELRRGADAAGRYRPHEAHRRALAGRKLDRPSRLARDHQLREWVEATLKRRWSPEQVSHGLRQQYPDQPDRWLCAETIYQAVYRPDPGGLSRELPDRVLRHRRRHRLRRRDAQHRRSAPVTGMTSIRQRPGSVLDRRESGHWEGDLIMGTANASTVITLVERTTRHTLPGHLPGGRHDSATVSQVLVDLLAPLPAALRRTLTWDQGKEMTRHHDVASTVEGLRIHFRDAHPPWQHPSNENANGLLRDYLPKGTNLALHTTDDLAEVQKQLNKRPRRSLDWASPEERLATLLPPTTVLRP